MGVQQLLELLLGIIYGIEALFPEGAFPSHAGEQIRDLTRHAHRAVCLGKAISFIALALATFLASPH